jgi:predicted transposase YbfD/YdcC
VLEKGIPSHDTFRRVFSIIDTDQFCSATVAFLIEKMDRIKKALKIKTEGYTQFCIDGKEENGTGRKYGTDQKIPNLQTLHIYNFSDGICLVSAPISEKTNEIPIAQKYLQALYLKDCIVTFDSMNTQKKTIAIIAKKGGDYVAALKGNHDNFHKDIKDFFTDDMLSSIREGNENYYTITEKAHNRIETRKYYLATDINWFAEKKLWGKLRSFICYELETEDLVSGKKTFERRYYISSLIDIELCAESIRNHWSVESMHWHLDTLFLEDDNTTTSKNAFNNLSILNKLVLTLYKLVQPYTKKQSIRRIRKGFGWDYENQFIKLLTLFDEDFLRDALLSVKV